MASAMPSTPTAPTAVSAVPATLQDRVVIYDGVCNLCHGTVKFLVQRDPQKLYRFCSLQSDAAKPYLAHFGITEEDALTSIVFVDGGKAYRKSAAALRIAAYLPMPWNWITYTAIIPAFVRDSVYDCVATNRYRVFGTTEERCLMPTKDIMSRFLDADEMKKQGRKKATKAE